MRDTAPSPPGGGDYSGADRQQRLRDLPDDFIYVEHQSPGQEDQGDPGFRHRNPD